MISLNPGNYLPSVWLFMTVADARPLLIDLPAFNTIILLDRIERIHSIGFSKLSYIHPAPADTSFPLRPACLD